MTEGYEVVDSPETLKKIKRERIRKMVESICQQSGYQSLGTMYETAVERAINFLEKEEKLDSYIEKVYKDKEDYRKKFDGPLVPKAETVEDAPKVAEGVLKRERLIAELSGA